MVRASELYKKGGAATIVYNWQPNGSVQIIVVTASGKHGSFKAKRLNTGEEEIWDDQPV